MYPFLPEAKALAPREVNMRDLEDAVSFLKNPLGEEIFKNPARHVALYALAKALLACCSQATKTRLAAQKAREYVERITVDGRGYEVGHVFFTSLQRKGDAYSLSLQDYLKYGENLVHQGAERGLVEIAQDELNALLQRAVQEKFLDVAVQKVPDEVQRAAAKLEPPTVTRHFGKLLSLGCMRRTTEGVEEGRRFYGAFGLSIAAKRDGLAKEQAESLLSQYVGRCHGMHPFTEHEAKSVLEWVYARSIGFSCKQTMDNGFEGEYCGACPLNWKKRRGK